MGRGDPFFGEGRDGNGTLGAELQQRVSEYEEIIDSTDNEATDKKKKGE